MNRIILNETSYFGAGCRSVIAVEAARRGFKKAFFVTDKDLIKFGVAAEIIKVFDDNHIPYELYSDVKANPTIANVQNGVATYKASGADFIVALGHEDRPGQGRESLRRPYRPALYPRGEEPAEQVEQGGVVETRRAASHPPRWALLPRQGLCCFKRVATNG